MLNRGVDKRNIIMDDFDRARFVHDLFILNDKRAAIHPKLPDRKDGTGKRVILVRIYAFCLMKNHYHLLLSETQPGGISLFMKKLNMGYAKYFNEKYSRTGALWQGKFKKKLVERNAHFMYLPYYVHLNPLDYYMPEWRRGGVKDTAKALAYLRTYRWSSHLDYLGEKNLPSITEREFLANIIGTRERYESEIGSIITSPTIAPVSESLE